ncbi:MAG TPA: proton-conducting transporter membrane subunit, partial [Elusimicrobiota bacterium]|nr:proton-conducting transporter membrane subunit [Elusimicrobiota bacterium]
MNQASQTESIDGFKGLAQRSMPLALTTMFFMLSLTGIPPFVGFIGKFSLFSAVLQSTGLVWLAVVAAVNSVISFAYYFSIVRAMFFETSDRPAPLSFSPALAGCLALTGVVAVAVGIFPNTFLLLVQKVLP